MALLWTRSRRGSKVDESPSCGDCSTHMRGGIELCITEGELEWRNAWCGTKTNFSRSASTKFRREVQHSENYRIRWEEERSLWNSWKTNQRTDVRRTSDVSRKLKGKVLEAWSLEHQEEMCSKPKSTGAVTINIGVYMGRITVRKRTMKGSVISKRIYWVEGRWQIIIIE